MQRLSENRFAGENHFPGNCTGENSRAAITVVARGHGLTFTSKRRSRGLRCRKEGGGKLSVIKAIFAGTLEYSRRKLGRSSRGERPFASENKTREIVIALKRSGRTTMTASG